MRQFLVLVALLFALLIGVSFAGNIHRSFDALAMVRPALCIGCLLGVFAARQSLLRFMFFAITLAAFASVLMFFIPQKAGGDVRVYSKNLWFANKQLPALVADIKQANVDAVMLQEVSDQNRHVLDLLRKDFPHQHLCRFSNWSGIAVASKKPFIAAPKCSTSRALAAVPINFENDRLWLVSAHIPWPWPWDSNMNEIAAEALLRSLKGKIVIAGDFNIFPWTSRVTRLSAITKTQAAGPTRFTLLYRHVPLPIDLALSPRGGSTEKRPLLGSDHAGLIADLAL